MTSTDPFSPNATGPLRASRASGTSRDLVRTQEWKYSYHSVGESQLYNLQDDPGETTNLIHERSFQSEKRSLHRDLLRWMEQTADPRAHEIEVAV